MGISTENSLTQRAKSATDSVHRGIDRASEVAHSTTDNAAASAAKLAERAELGADKLYEKQQQVRAKTVGYTNLYPMRAIVISLGVGFVLAKLLRSSSSTK